MARYSIDANTIAKGTLAIWGYGPKSGITDAPDTPDLLETMASQRTKLRSILVEAKEAPTMSSYESLFVSNLHI